MVEPETPFAPGSRPPCPGSSTTIGRPGDARFGQLDLADRGAKIDLDATRTRFPDQRAAVRSFLEPNARWPAPSAAAASTTPAMMIAAPAVALARFDLGAMTSSYHANMVNAQLSLDFSGSSAPVAVAALARGC